MYTIENINTLRLRMGMEPIYRDVHSVFDHADTGERFGFHNSHLPTSNSESFQLVDHPSTERALPVRTLDEIKKFNLELGDHLPKPNFDHWSIKWNICIDSMKKFGGEMLDIAPKKAYHLKKYYDQIKVRANRNNTTANSQQNINHIRQELRSPDTGDHPTLHQTGSLERKVEIQAGQPSPSALYSSGIAHL